MDAPLLLVLLDEEDVVDDDEELSLLEVEGVLGVELSEEVDGVDDGLGLLAELVLERESLMYQPLPLKTMPTG
ncbi:MAG TPA: hypothetical protein VGL99_26660 [Chloroflexota bacterium]